jgi:3-hydroxybutyryl-CoA dehydratase
LRQAASIEPHYRQSLEARPVSDWSEGDSARFSKTITETDLTHFAQLTGDTNPLHLDSEYARRTQFGQRIAHGLLTAGLISTVIGTRLPGRGAIYAGQTLAFIRPVFIGDTITATATITDFDRARGRMTLSTTCTNQLGEEVLSGQADVLYRPID